MLNAKLYVPQPTHRRMEQKVITKRVMDSAGTNPPLGRVFERLSKTFGLFDQNACPFS